MAADEMTRRVWASAERVGRPYTPAQKAFESVNDELRGHTTANQYLVIASHVKRWVETRNPHYMDAAVYCCLLWELPETETVQAEKLKAIKLRFTGGASGTPEKVNREGMTTWCFNFMANLIFEGVKLEDAASKVAAAAGQMLKASTLARYYADRYHKGTPSIEDEMFRVWSRDREGHAAEWKPLIEVMPDTPEHERGERR